jgi:hypothetical protein
MLSRRSFFRGALGGALALGMEHPSASQVPRPRSRRIILFPRSASAGVLLKEKERALVDPHLPKHSGVIVADVYVTERISPVVRNPISMRFAVRCRAEKYINAMALKPPVELDYDFVDRGKATGIIDTQFSCGET